MSPADAARDALRRLAREQDAASPMPVIATRLALATTRGEAARAVLELFDALPCTPGVNDDETIRRADDIERAHAQYTALRGSDDISSATLDAWADGWDAYARRATLAGGAS